jgi:hypothetical protein
LARSLRPGGRHVANIAALTTYLQVVHAAALLQVGQVIARSSARCRVFTIATVVLPLMTAVIKFGLTVYALV